MPCQHSHISVPSASRSERISNCPVDNGGSSRMLLEVSLPSLDSLSRITVAKNDVLINEHGHSVLTNLIGRLTAYDGPFEGLQNKAECNESNTIRLLAQDHIGGPLAVCGDALGFIRRSLEKPQGQLWRQNTQQGHHERPGET
ncbi:hypothetical protein WAI453_001598 [Rhynchosporium graminicola]